MGTWCFLASKAPTAYTLQIIYGRVLIYDLELDVYTPRT